MSTMEQFLAGVRHDLETVLDSLVPAADVEPRRLHEAIRWSLFAGGKRIRPAILVAVGEVFAARRSSLLGTAAAVEMLHTYSLIHDDLPAMDDDELRRGRATCHKQFDEATAILAGDALQSIAFRTIADDGSISHEKRVRLISVIGAAAGTPAGMVSGQQLDLDGEGRTLSLDEIEIIHSQKTGALIRASALAGAIIGGAGTDEQRAVEAYAGHLGLLFQITDDLLDVTAPTEELGKTAGKDAAANKSTYAGNLGVDGTLAKAADVHEAACAALDLPGRDTRLLADLAAMVLGRTR